MADSEWYSYLEGTIFSYVESALTSSYGELNCTTNEVNTTPTEFPTVEIRELEPIERGQDLDNITVNAVLETIQIRVFSQSKDDCQKLCRLTTSAMKNLRFNVTAMFFIQQLGTDVYFAAGRFRRMIGAGDTDIVV